MANIKILEEDFLHKTHQYLVDEVSDLQELPEDEVGSFALVAATSDVYVLNNKKVWVKL